MKCASIDIGTNTLRLLVSEVEGGELRPLVYDRVITRLGGNFTHELGIDAESAERTFAALGKFAGIIRGHGVGAVRAVATSVVRRAANRGSFLKEVERRTGIKAEVITGDEEARLSLLGVLSVIKSEGCKRLLVVDVGGGSTEYIAVEGDLKKAWSMDMGVVHLTEKHLKSDPPKRVELDGLEAEIGGVIEELKWRMTRGGFIPSLYASKKGTCLVGTAGTITTLAALDQDLTVYDRDRVNNWVLRAGKIREIYKRLSGLTLKEREEVLTLEKGREDLIIPGSAIALITMDVFGFDEMRVSDAGLLEGVLIDFLKKRPS